MQNNTKLIYLVCSLSPNQQWSSGGLSACFAIYLHGAVNAPWHLTQKEYNGWIQSITVVHIGGSSTYGSSARWISEIINYRNWWYNGTRLSWGILKKEKSSPLIIDLFVWQLHFTSNLPNLDSQQRHSVVYPLQVEKQLFDEAATDRQHCACPRSC